MRRAGFPIVIMILASIWLVSCTQSRGAADADTASIASHESMGLAADASDVGGMGSDGGSIPVLSRAVRTILDDQGQEVSEVYDIEHDGTELRTTVVHRDGEGRKHRSDAFFNVDGTLSFVRQRDARGNTRTVHFVYDSAGNPVERIESQDDVPIRKIQYKYDSSREFRRELVVYHWDGGKWRRTDGHSLLLFVNSAGIPTAFEDVAPEGKRTIVFEYADGGDALDGYVDTRHSVDGEERSVSGFVTFKDGRPEELVVRSDSDPDSELQVFAEWSRDATTDVDKLVGEIVKRCQGSDCLDVERRRFDYERLDSQPMIPPPAIVLPFLEVGSSLFYMEKPDILLGREGIGLPSSVDF